MDVIARLNDDAQSWREGAKYWRSVANQYFREVPPPPEFEQYAQQHERTAEMYERISAVVTAASEWVASHGNPHFEEKLLVAVAALNKGE